MNWRSRPRRSSIICPRPASPKRRPTRVPSISRQRKKFANISRIWPMPKRPPKPRLMPIRSAKDAAAKAARLRPVRHRPLRPSRRPLQLPLRRQLPPVPVAAAAPPAAPAARGAAPLRRRCRGQATQLPAPPRLRAAAATPASPAAAATRPAVRSPCPRPAARGRRIGTC